MLVVRFFVFFFISFSVYALSREESTSTEARFEHDTRLNLDFCCGRPLPEESAHDLSNEESQRRVNKILYTQGSVPVPIPAPGQK